jgi:hypothetical protein
LTFIQERKVMADRDEQERKARIYCQALAQLTTTANASHPLVTPKPVGESERVNQIILSNLAAKDD